MTVLGGIMVDIQTEEQTKRNKTVIYMKSSHMTGGCVMVHDSKPGFPLHQCGFLSVLQIVCTIYTTYGTTEAVTYAQHHNTGTTGSVFGTHVPNTPSPNLSEIPLS